ncbi:MAG: cytochrome c [Chloroflexota bacterium]
MLKQNNRVWLFASFLLMIVLVACGSRPSDRAYDDDEPTTDSSDSGIQAMPTANFSSVGEQSGITITTNIEVPAEDAEDDGPDLAMGERVYGNRCAECHGPTADGIPDMAPTLIGLSLSLHEFEDLLRTGGDLGPEHLFGTRVVSANGLAAMHAYLSSLE